MVASSAHHFTSKSAQLVNSFATHQSISYHKISAVTLYLPIYEVGLCGTARQKYNKYKVKDFLRCAETDTLHNMIRTFQQSQKYFKLKVLNTDFSNTVIGYIKILSYV
jgi:hypothetical protein